MPLFAQKIKFYGKFVIEKGNMDLAVIHMEKNGVSVRTIKPNGQKFDFLCEPDAEYVFKFEKPGYITKKIAISTKSIPQERLEEGFDPYKFEVYLFPQVDGVNTVVFNQPVGRIMYKQDLDDIGFDTDYTKSIEAMMKDFEAEYKAAEKEAPPKPEAIVQTNAPVPAVVQNVSPKTTQIPAPPLMPEPTKQAVQENKLIANTNPIQSPTQSVSIVPVLEESLKKSISPQVEEEKPKKASGSLADDYKKFSTGSEESEKRKAIIMAEDEDRRRRMLAAMSEDEVRRNAVAARIEEDKRNQYPKRPVIQWQRTENYIKEARRDISEIVLSGDGYTITFRKIQYEFGQIYYFKNDRSISKWMYENAFANN